MQLVWWILLWHDAVLRWIWCWLALFCVLCLWCSFWLMRSVCPDFWFGWVVLLLVLFDLFSDCFSKWGKLLRQFWFGYMILFGLPSWNGFLNWWWSVLNQFADLLFFWCCCDVASVAEMLWWCCCDGVCYDKVLLCCCWMFAGVWKGAWLFVQSVLDQVFINVGWQ